MNSSVTPPVTTPSSTLLTSERRVNCARRGRTISSISTPARNRRSQAAPSAPIRSISPTETASPTWTLSMAVIAISTPVRAVCETGSVVMTPVKSTESFAST